MSHNNTPNAVQWFQVPALCILFNQCHNLTTRFVQKALDTHLISRVEQSLASSMDHRYRGVTPTMMHGVCSEVSLSAERIAVLTSQSWWHTTCLAARQKRDQLLVSFALLWPHNQSKHLQCGANRCQQPPQLLSQRMPLLRGNVMYMHSCYLFIH